MYKVKPRLAEFKKFATSLLPHEIRLLQIDNQLADPERLAILDNLEQWAQGNQIPFDDEIDKRKYSHIKKWISEKLNECDVDHEYQWLLDLEKDIIQDAISSFDEEKLMQYISGYSHPSFYFVKLYEVVRLYSHFLLPRLRFKHYRFIQHFLTQYEYSYKEHTLILDTLQKVSKPIVIEYAKGKLKSSDEWTTWLNNIIYNENIQGYYRYLALIRVHFIALQYNDYNSILKKYEYFDPFFSKKGFYSRRIVGNYYYNLMNIHSGLKNYKKANAFGYLAIRVRNHDFLQYSTQLAANLLNQNLVQEALEVLKNAHEAYKVSNNHLRKTDFVSYYMQCLQAMGQSKAGANYGHTYLAVYKKEIMENRWNLFFKNYLTCLLDLNKFREAKLIIEKNNLVSKEKEMAKIKSYNGYFSGVYKVCRAELYG